MNPSFTHRFHAIRGKQAGQEYYVALCPLRLIPKLFVFDDADVPAELRAQRTINRSRVPDIARYLSANPTTYVLSSITASIDGEVSFEPIDSAAPDIGMLTVSMTSRLLINDGQHRRAAIEEALADSPELGDDTISVVLFADSGLHRSQQMFADLNRYAVRPSQSLGILYDQRDGYAQIVREIADEVVPFQGLVDWEKTSLAERSAKLFTASAVYQGVRAVIGACRDDSAPNREESQLAVEFWKLAGKCMPDWMNANARTVAPSELRREYIHAHGVALSAIGRAGHHLVGAHPEDWQSKLTGLSTVDWRRSNPLWDGTVIVNGRVTKANNAIDALAATIIDACELSEGQSSGRRVTVGSAQ